MGASQYLRQIAGHRTHMSSSRARKPSCPEAMLSGGQPGPVVACDRAGNTEAACRHETMQNEVKTEVAARHSIGCPARRGPGLSGLAIASAKSQAIGQNVDLEAPRHRSSAPSARDSPSWRGSVALWLSGCEASQDHADRDERPCRVGDREGEVEHDLRSLFTKARPAGAGAPPQGRNQTDNPELNN